MKEPCDETAIHNLESLADKTNISSQNDSIDISSFEDIETQSFIQNLYHQRGDIFASSTGNYIITLSLDNISLAKKIQKTLRSFQINSTLVKDESNSNISYLFISQKNSLKNFREKISSEFVNGSEIIEHYIFKIDWED
ncbi:MAG: LAGLIDADG family homing endonuclease [Candidatus Thorarchaeota archaeon]